MLDAHARLARDRPGSLELHFEVGAQVEHHLERLLLDEQADVPRGQRLQVVGAQQHAGHDDAGVGGPVERDPADVPVLECSCLDRGRSDSALTGSQQVRHAACDNRARWEIRTRLRSRGSSGRRAGPATRSCRSPIRTFPPTACCSIASTHALGFRRRSSDRCGRMVAGRAGASGDVANQGEAKAYARLRPVIDAALGGSAPSCSSRRAITTTWRSCARACSDGNRSAARSTRSCASVAFGSSGWTRASRVRFTANWTTRNSRAWPRS